MYANETDLVNRYGQAEIVQLTDRATTQANVIDTVLLEAKIEDAENEINKFLSCCFDMRQIWELYDSGKEIPLLKTWTCKITRKNLYDSIRLGVSNNASDHQAQREYQEVIKEIDEICKCGHLLDEDFNQIVRKRVFHMKVDPSCVKLQCCPTKDKRGLTHE